jgi:DNA-binding PadR family transcriptional regulator
MFSRHRHGAEHRGCGHRNEGGERRHAHGPFGPREHLRGHGRHGGGRHGRPLDHGDLKWIALRLIAERPRHGYEIIKAIEEHLGGMYSPSPGSVYPTLTLLEELGFVAASADGAKKLYTLTPDGAAHLADNRASVAAAEGRMAAAREAFGGGPAPEVIRAMHNLREAVRLRLGKGPLESEAVGRITAALDRAAGEIERA